MKIYCKEISRKRSISNFIQSYVDNGCPETQYRNGKIQCDPYTHRSLEELYFLAKTEYHSLTKKKFLKIVSNLAVKNNHCLMQCRQVRKITYYTSANCAYFSGVPKYAKFGLYYPKLGTPMFGFFNYSVNDIYNILIK